MNINLNFVLVILQSSKYSEYGTNLDSLLGQPRFKVILTFPACTHHAGPVIVKPEDTGHHTCRVIYTKKEAILFSDLEHYGPRDGYLGQQEMISEDKEYLAGVLIVLSLIFVVESILISLFYGLINSFQSLLMHLIAHLLGLIVTLIMISSILLRSPVSERENIIPKL